MKNKWVFGSIGSGKWHAGGATAQVFEQSTLAIDGTTHDTWCLSEPGAWKRHYYRTASSAVPAQLVGLLCAEEDAHGNITFYDYELFHDPENVDEETWTARLVRVYLDGTPATGGASGHIVFNWNIGADSDVQGKLSSIQVFQRGDGGVVEMTHRVNYTYKESGSDYEGTPGDLVQVIKYDRVDKAPAGEPFRTRVTQYR